MTLLDEIIDAAVDEKVPIGTLLRKCLVLEQQVKNEKFRVWLDRELDGDDQEELPPYRVFNCVNKGLFFAGTTMLNDQPIPVDVMEEKDRELIEKVFLNQPAASYDNRPNQSANAAVPWNPSLTAKYQTKFFRPPTVAWQEIPGSILVGLLEQIRTRVLRFALELKDNLPPMQEIPHSSRPLSLNVRSSTTSTAATFSLLHMPRISLRCRTPPSQ